MHQRAMSFQSHKKTLTSNIFEDSVLNEASGIRTPDNLIKSQVLYQLSYTPLFSYNTR